MWNFLILTSPKGVKESGKKKLVLCHLHVSKEPLNVRKLRKVLIKSTNLNLLDC